MRLIIIATSALIAAMVFTVSAQDAVVDTAVSVDETSAATTAEISAETAADTSAEKLAVSDDVGDVDTDVNINADIDVSADAEAAASVEASDTAPASRTPAPVRIGGANRLDGIAAVVGTEIILISELEAYAFMRLAALGIRPEDANLPELIKLSMEELIDDKVVVARARGDSAITVRNDEVESMLNNHINMILRQNRITMEQFEMQLRIQQGTTMARFRTEARRAIREQLYKQKIQQNFFFNVSVSRRDVERFYAEYADSLPVVGASMELLKLSLRVSASDSVRQAAFDKINRIKKLIDGGAAFDSLARQYSDGPEAASGGDLGFLSKGSTTEIALEERAFSLPVGRISEPFETRLGYHIIVVEEIRDRRVRLRQIMVRHAPTEAEREAVAARLDSLRRGITTREAFEAAARSLSVDLATRSRGGDMGWIGLTEMPAPVRDAVLPLEEGQISAPITEGGVMSIYMLSKRADTRRLTIENDYPAISEMARDITAQKRLKDAVKMWRDRTFIDIRI